MDAPLAPKARYDVAVVGGGITGCATAYELARAGASVALLERHEIGTEASGRNAGSLHGQIQYEPFRTRGEGWARGFLPALAFLHASLERWSTLSGELGTDLEVTRHGGLLLVEDQAELPFVEAKIALERATGVDSRLLDAGELRELAPWAAPSVVAAGFCPVEGKANPMLAAPAFARRAVAAGAEVFTRTAVTAVEPAAGEVRIVTPLRTFAADQVVLASGRRLSAQAAGLGARLAVSDEPVQVCATEPVEPLIHHLVYYAGERLTLKQARAGTVLIGGGWPARTDPTTGYPLVDMASLRSNLRVALTVAPQLAGALVIRSWAGVGNGTPDEGPLLGTLRSCDRVHAGLFPYMGLTAGPLMGEVLASLVQRRQPPVDLSPFAPERFEDR